MLLYIIEEVSCMMDRVVVDRVFCYSTAEAKKNEKCWLEDSPFCHIDPADDTCRAE